MNNIPSRYETALADLFTYQMGDGPAGVPRHFIARTWLPPDAQPEAWLMNAMRLAEAVECSVIVRNIIFGVADDIADGTIDQYEGSAIRERLNERVTLLDFDDASAIMNDLNVPMVFNQCAHETIDHIDVIPFTLDTGFKPSIIDRFSGRIPICNDNR